MNAALSCCIPLAVCSLAGSAVVGCEDAAPPAATTQPVRHVLISQADVDALPPGESLRVDLAAPRVAYHVALEPELQTDRIVLVSGPLAEATLTAEIDAIEGRAMEPLAPTDGRLTLSGDPTVFEVLDADELSTLRAEGLLVQEVDAPAASKKPQSEDPCGLSGVYMNNELASGASAVSAWSAHLVAVCDPVCTANATEACYSGPPITEGVGMCQAGQRTCNLTGTAWGPCTGEVRPIPEACGSATDDDCNGSLGCKPGHLWSELFGDASYQLGNKTLYDLATDAAGNVLLAGTFTASLPVGGQTLTGAGLYDAFVIKLDPNGNVLWARRFGSNKNDIATAITTDAAGNAIVAGLFWNTVDFGAGPLTSAGSGDLFVLKLDPSGATIWSQRFGGTSGESPDAVAVGAGGEITVAGRYNGNLDFGFGPLPSDPKTRTFVVRLDPTGVPLWSRGFDVGEAMAPHGLALTPSGDAVIGGWTTGWVDFGGGPTGGAGSYDGFAVRLASASGATVWGKVIGSPGEDRVTGVAVDSGGDVVVAGGIGGGVSLGGGVTLSGAGGSDILLAKLDGATGDGVWGQALGNAAEQEASALALDSADNIMLLGHYHEALDLGDGLMTSRSSFEPSRFLAKLSPSGALLWSRGHAFQIFSVVYGATDERALATDAAGNVLFGGTAFVGVDYGGGTLTPLGNMDVVVAKYAP